MLMAAKAIVQIQYDDVTSDPEEIVDEFKDRFFDTELIYDKFAGPKFANYLFHAHEEDASVPTTESAHRRLEEAQLFLPLHAELEADAILLREEAQVEVGGVQ